MKTWKGYNILDLILLLTGIIVVSLSGLFFYSEWYVFICTIVGLICVFTQAKGKVITQFIGVVHFCFYIFIAYSQNYYGEALAYIIIMMPMYVYGIIHWLANRDKDNNVVLVRSNLSKKEWLCMSVALIVVSVAIVLLLNVFNTTLLVVNALSFITLLPAVYLLMRRCKWNQVAFLLNDFIAPFLWIFLVAQGNTSFLPMCIYHIFQITYDVYGLIEWIKLENKQKEQKCKKNI